MKRALSVAGLQELEEINHCIQAENVELRRLLQEAREEKKRLLCQLQAKDEALEKLQHHYPEVKSDSSISYDFHDDEFVAFEKHTTRIGSKLLKKIGH